ncbi:MAG: hypothetical protein SFV21_04430 [Rhodospirillaceae bacterium]|nr:hypothetical protein [Rhodospirillaceae bacterium]
MKRADCRRALRRCLSGLTMLAVAGANAPVDAQNGALGLRDQAHVENECKLTYLRNTKSSAARSYIEKACNFRSLTTSGGALAQTERVFHDCILEVLPGTEDDRNAVQLANACKSRSWSTE